MPKDEDEGEYPYVIVPCVVGAVDRNNNEYYGKAKISTEALTI